MIKHSASIISLIYLILFLGEVNSFQTATTSTGHLPTTTTLFLSETTNNAVEEQTDLRSATAAKFKVLTCTSTACSKRRKTFGMDDLATFGAFYSRAKKSFPETMQVEEAPCLGSCKFGPCVGVEHEDYYGTVALEGMTQDEFGASCFHNIITEEDADRVWACVENAVEVMMEAEDDDEE
ncbi:expressed unknown protein [Seminavis robusta]|uniref:Uncharacterized protein n=1 Tax=Seminavis robusta TaxID=568900 RepID=A0A9N8H948_9STRA|nr:expressed unknown protein [Seminavis robusta]|eukprot:Sro263_g102280.1 n/a (180) ;mRNA; f:41532-42330